MRSASRPSGSSWWPAPSFATVKPDEQRRVFEGFLGGPVGHSEKTSFTLSMRAAADDVQRIDDMRFHLEHAGFEHGKQPDRPGADDDDICLKLSHKAMESSKN